MKKKLMVPSFILVLTLALVGCNTSGNETKPIDNNESTVEKEQEVDKNKNTDTIKDSDQEVDVNKENSNEEKVNKSKVNKETVIDGVVYDDLKVSPSQAFDKFMDLHSQSKVTEVKLDTKYDELEYKIEGYDSSNEYQVRINAQSGDIKSDDTKNLDKDDLDEGVISKDDIDKVNNIVDESMKKTNENTKFKKWSLEDNDGKLELEVEFKDNNNDVEYTYDLQSGKLKEKGD